MCAVSECRALRVGQQPPGGAVHLHQEAQYTNWAPSDPNGGAVENCCLKARDLGPQWAGWLDYGCDQDQASTGTGPGTAEILALCETQIPATL